MNNKKNNILLNIPNFITFFRIIIIPIFILLYYSSYKWNHIICCLIFITASISDFLDGYLARKLNQTSHIGSSLDHVADKLLVIFVLFIIVEKSSSRYLCIPSLIIIFREIIVLAIRELIAKFKFIKCDFFYIGKIKTFLQMISIIVLLIFDINKPNYITWIGFIFFYLSSIITFYSMLLYIINVYNKIKKTKNMRE